MADGFSVESGLGLGGGLGEEDQEELVRLLALRAGGLKEAAQDAMILQAAGRAGALDHFAHDDHGAQTALGLVIGGWDARMAEASEEMLLFRAGQALAEGVGPGGAQCAVSNHSLVRFKRAIWSDVIHCKTL